MTTLLNTFEGGASGTGITTANSGGGSGDVITVATQNASFQYSNLSFVRGALSGRIDCGASNSYVRASWLVASRVCRFRRFFRFTGFPVTAVCNLLQIRNEADTATQFLLRINLDGTISILTGGGSVLWTSTHVLDITGTIWYRFEGIVDNSGGTGAGTCEFRLYVGQSSVATDGVSLTASEFGAINFGRLHTGKYATAGTMPVFLTDDWANEDTTGALFGPSDTLGMRWYAIRDVSGTPTLVSANMKAL